MCSWSYQQKLNTSQELWSTNILPIWGSCFSNLYVWYDFKTKLFTESFRYPIIYFQQISNFSNFVSRNCGANLCNLPLSLVVYFHILPPCNINNYTTQCLHIWFIEMLIVSMTEEVLKTWKSYWSRCSFIKLILYEMFLY